jgi:prepilin-type N-terminal cleavage/methylation domain-containing protein
MNTSLRISRVIARRRRLRRRGFSLVETIVTVGLLAVLAAFVVPSVVQKAGVADPVRLQNDLGAIRTAIETFSADLAGEFPGDLEDLTTSITTTDSSLTRQLYTSSQVAQWKGPYFSSSVKETDNTVANAAKVRTGFGADIISVLQRYDATHDMGEVSGGTGTTFSDTASLFVAIKIVNLTMLQAQTINELVDGNADPDQPVAGSVTIGTNTTGRLRYKTTASGSTAYYLAAPISR